MRTSCPLPRCVARLRVAAWVVSSHDSQRSAQAACRPQADDVTEALIAWTAPLRVQGWHQGRPSPYVHGALESRPPVRVQFTFFLRTRSFLKSDFVKIIEEFRALGRALI